MKKFIITGPSTYGVKNAGDDGMFHNLVQGLKREFPGCDIVFVCRHPDPIFDRTFGVRSIQNIEHSTKALSQGRWFYGFNPGDNTRHLTLIRQELATCDAVIIGGNAFMEITANDYLRGVASYAALFAQWAILFNKPYYLYGIAVHPAIQGEHTQQIARFMCANARLVLAREDFSKQCLVDIGIPEANIRVVIDPVFGLSPVSSRTPGMHLLRQEGIKLSRDVLIGVDFRALYWLWTEKELAEHTQKMAQICDIAITQFEAEILFISNCTYHVDTPLEDDRFIARHIYDKMQYSTYAHILTGDYLLPDILTFFPLLSLHISNRRHSCINAAIHHIPFLPFITEMPKHIIPFLRTLRLTHHVVDFLHSDVSEIQTTLRKIWEDRQTIISTLHDVTPGLRYQAHQYTSFIFEDFNAFLNVGRE